MNSVLVISHSYGKRIVVQLTSSEFPQLVDLNLWQGALLEGGWMLLHMRILWVQGADG